MSRLVALSTGSVPNELWKACWRIRSDSEFYIFTLVCWAFVFNFPWKFFSTYIVYSYFWLARINVIPVKQLCSLSTTHQSASLHVLHDIQNMVNDSKYFFCAKVWNTPEATFRWPLIEMKAKNCSKSWKKFCFKNSLCYLVHLLQISHESKHSRIWSKRFKMWHAVMHCFMHKRMHQHQQQHHHLH